MRPEILLENINTNHLHLQWSLIIFIRIVSLGFELCD
jgi:hypothetical protein